MGETAWWQVQNSHQFAGEISQLQCIMPTMQQPQRLVNRQQLARYGDIRQMAAFNNFDRTGDRYTLVMDRMMKHTSFIGWRS